MPGLAAEIRAPIVPWGEVVRPSGRARQGTIEARLPDVRANTTSPWVALRASYGDLASAYDALRAS